MKSPDDFREIFDHLSLPVLLIDRSYGVVMMNAAAEQHHAEDGVLSGRTCFDLTHRLEKPCWTVDGTDCPLKRVFETGERARVIHQHARGSQLVIEEITATPVRDDAGEIAFVIEELRDVTELLDLRNGLLPICASCKKIRDSKGSWHSLEAYFRDHTGASFSHSLCDECFERRHPEAAEDDG